MGEHSFVNYSDCETKSYNCIYVSCKLSVEHSQFIMAQVYSQVQFNYSMKNIPIPSRDEYVLQLIHSVEKFIKNLRWRVKCFQKPPTEQKETYGFPSPKHPGSVQDLKLLEQRLLAMVRDIQFRNFTDEFQEKL